MTLKRKIKKLLFGIDYPQEYLCLGFDENEDYPTVHLHWSESDQPIDITTTHLFLGYKPLIIGIPLDQAHENLKQIRASNSVKLVFSQPNSFAEIELQFSHQIQLEDNSVLLFEGKKATHQLISPIHQKLHRRLQGRIKKSNDPLQLSGNLYDQVRVAYAYPRFISLISLGKGNTYNLFPTDLNGPVDNTHFLISLREDGRASAQVDEIGDVLIARIDANFYKEAYQMGKNHMKELRDKDELKFSDELSHYHQFPIPQSTVSYWELEKIRDHTIGIHKIHQFKIAVKSEEKLLTPSLAHIHNFYAQWKKDNEIESQYYLR